MKEQLKALLRAVAPKRYDAFMAARVNRHGRRVMAAHDVPAITAALVARHGSAVLGGPFAGMVYLTDAVGSSLLPKLVGSYERELHGAWEQILGTRYDAVADVGSAEGFYAVGLAMRLPGAPDVHAFDLDPAARGLCRSLARMNRVGDRVVNAGFCDAGTLQNTLRGRALILCDCEGYEAELLRPDLAPILLGADILVELHDDLRPGATRLVTDRFAGSHQVLMIESTGRDPADYPALGFLTPEQQRTAVSEFRPAPQRWAFMRPKPRPDHPPPAAPGR